MAMEGDLGPAAAAEQAQAQAASSDDDGDEDLQALREYCARRFGPTMDQDWLVAMRGRNDGDNADQRHKRYASIATFVHQLGLPRVHPLCSRPLLRTIPSTSEPPRVGSNTAPTERETNEATSTAEAAAWLPRWMMSRSSSRALRLSRLRELDADAFVTRLYQMAPPRIAFAQLWVKYLSGPLAVLGILVLLVIRFRRTKARGRGREWNRCFSDAGPGVNGKIPETKGHEPTRAPASLEGGRPNRPCWARRAVQYVSLASSYVVLMDPMYRYEYGLRSLQGFFAAAGVLSLWEHVELFPPLASVPSFRRPTCKSLLRCVGIMALLSLSVQDFPKTPQRFYYDENEPVMISPGLYFNTNNKLIRLAVTRYWPAPKLTYGTANATFWMHTGDARTGIPYFINHVPDLEWKPVFLTLPSHKNNTSSTSDMNGTSNDLDVVLELALSFPAEGHDPSKPLYLVLHGMNGGTGDGYIRDLTWRRNKAGSTVAVLIARGFMNSPLDTDELFHGARWSDVHAAAVALKKAMGPNQLLVGVGYSMGAIVVANYAVRSGPSCALDAAVAISGALECRVEQNYTRAQRLWQPMVASVLRTGYFDRFVPRLASRLGPDDMRGYRRATHVVGLDKYASAKYNGYDRLEDFYADMGALGDIPLSELNRPDFESLSTPPHIRHLKIPLLVLHAFDDPLSTWRTVAANRGILHPKVLVGGASNLVLLLTEKGGHVGWPVGMLPFRRKWEFMNEVASSFAEAIDKARIDLATNSTIKDPDGVDGDGNGDDDDNNRHEPTDVCPPWPEPDAPAMCVSATALRFLVDPSTRASAAGYE